MGLLRSALMLGLLLLASTADAAVGYDSNGYDKEPRLQLEADVPLAAIGRARHFVAEGRVTEGDAIDLQFVLKKRDSEALRALHETLMAVSDPRSPQYGQHLSIDDITALVGPPPAHSAAVRAFLKAYGVPAARIHVNRNRDIVTARAVLGPVAEVMLGTKFYRFRSTIKPGVTVIRAVSPYSLPASVARVVALVAELLRFPAVRHLPSRRRQADTDNATTYGLNAEDPFNACGDVCAGFTTPAVLAQRYGFDGAEAALGEVAPGNAMSVAEFQLQFYDRRDLARFGGQCGVDAVGVQKTYDRNVALVCTRGEGCVESLLDIEYINAAAPGVPLSVYYSTQYSILDWISTVNDNIAPELVHSVSYGNDEAQQTSVDYMEAVNVEFMKAGARGISIFIASGDQGVYGREGPEGDVFHPDFPASSPYVTAVGGTNFASTSVVGEEVVWDGSGGGFSDTFSIPDYQAAAVAGYKMAASAAGTLPPEQMWNATGRGYPDLSALGGEVNPYCVAVAGGRELGGVWGTSASTPVVAGIFARLNNLRLSAGKPPLGFVNPFIYQNADCFHDVLKGVNDGGGEYGFACAEGWDPATGLGTPDFALLKTRV